MKFSDFNVKNIIFDLGGVILTIDIKTTFGKFENLGLGNGLDGYHLINHNHVFKKYETGIFSTHEFREELRKISSKQFSNQEFDDLWNSIIVGFPQENIELLQSLKPHYRLFLMSNTNALHYDFYNDIIQQQFNLNSLDDLFEKAYYSHLSKMRKPDPGFFELILDENKLSPQETLFVDDFIENIEAASALGIKTLHLTEKYRLNDFV
ncbi:MAG: HAD family phosphatase [Bacteroidales bacterium]